jgi:DNA-binding FadR family transcriptional regulator
MAGGNGTKRKAHEVVAIRLRQRIVSGELKAGDRLPPEDELTAQFGIARTTLREALRVLESQGLIAIRRGRGGGPEVTHPDLRPAATALAVSLQLQHTTIGDLDAARRMIEPQIAGLLARKQDPADIAAIEAVIDQADDAAEHDDAARFGVHAAAMHETLMECSGNNTMATLSRLLHEVVEEYYTRSMAAADQTSMRRAVRSYRKLLKLIRAGDTEGAITHWEAQMLYTVSGHDGTSEITLAAGS